MDIKKVKQLVEKSKKITILTGAGISTESGISDFRSPGGIWSRYRTVTLQEMLRDITMRKYYWRYKSETIPSMLKAEPNAAHNATGRLDAQGRLFYLLTQNIDGLHEKGGVNSARIVNLHGTNLEAVCWECGKIYKITDILPRLAECDYNPACDECGGFVKPNTVAFGQNLNPDHLAVAEAASTQCDLFMALGSSLVVHPVCGYVETAFNSGRPVIIINRDPTPYDQIADFKLTESLAEIMPVLIS